MRREIPILYSTPMVQAKLAGRKTVTRRPLRFQPDNDCYFELRKEARTGRFGIVIDYNLDDENPFVPCPYGQPGDIHWGRESFALEKYFNGLTEECIPIFKADYEGPVAWNWKPSIHMPKAIARLWDEVVSVRPEQLMDITEEDAIREGIEVEKQYKEFTIYKAYHGPAIDGGFTSAISAYQNLWEFINGSGSWDPLLWVWRIETRQLSITGRPTDKNVPLMPSK